MQQHLMMVTFYFHSDIVGHFNAQRCHYILKDAMQADMCMHSAENKGIDFVVIYYH